MRWPSLCLTARGLLGAAAVSGACQSTHDVPDQPTWVDVEPIVRGACTQCHGANAEVAGSFGGGVYRFDFYDMTDDVCGEAAEALRGEALGKSWATLMAADVTAPGSGWRARMPPSPAGQLADWERETIVRWAKNPLRGTPLRVNYMPTLELIGKVETADKALVLTAVVRDFDNEPVVGVLKVGDTRLVMGRSGAFTATLDTSSWANGPLPLSATLCDGWNHVGIQLGSVMISHDAPTVTAVAPADGGATGDGAAADVASPDQHE